jgi:hypothetical protein
MLGVVLAGVLAPLLRVPTFYYWDDTASASVSAWRNIGDALLEGRLPLLDLDLWRGGNYAAEAAFGVYNPLLLALYVATNPIDNLVLATVVVKGFFFLTMALGAYLLARQYGARPWAAALAGTMLPLSGFTLWMDGAAWVTGLTVTALTPWVWYTAKRAAEGRGSLLWVVAAGYICASAGNPYGLLSAAIVLAAVILEVLLARDIRRAVGVTVAGAAVGLLSVATYLPFVLSSSVSYRTGSGTYNDEFLAPSLTDLLGASSPSFTPYVTFYTWPVFTFPALYLSWFLVPLLPWLRWSALRNHLPRLTALYLVGGLYLLLVLGPSQVWFFRWPMRLAPYFYLSAAVLFVVLLSAGLHRSRMRLRAGLSAAAVGWGFWVAWSDVPPDWDRHLFSAAMVGGLLAALLWAARRSERLMSLVAMAGTLVVLVVQLAWMPYNMNVIEYQFPRSETELEADFAGYRPGLTVQLASIELATASGNPAGVYEDVLFGSMYAVGEVESTSAYSGVGFNSFDRELCMRYQGATCEDAWDALWNEPRGSDVVLADLLRAQRVVVQRELLDTGDERAPEGWELRESTEFVDVWERIEPLSWPEGRISAVDGPVSVISDERTGDVGETVEFTREGSGASSLTFARLAWPGYTATVDGVPVPVEEGPAGLLVVELPDDVRSGTLTLSWSPPGSTVSLAATALGAVAALTLGVLEYRRRRTTADDDAGLGNEARAAGTQEN